MEVQDIQINKIKIGKNSRAHIGTGDLSELMASIKEVGLLQPIGVVKRGASYEITCGNRRFLAMSKLGLTKIPAVIHTLSKDSDVDIMNLTENIQRRNISLPEIGRYVLMLEEQEMTRKEIAIRLGVTRKYLGYAVDAFQRVPKEFRDDLEVRVDGEKAKAGKIPMSTATKIIEVTRRLQLSTEQEKALYKAAKTKNDFMPENIRQYAIAMKTGKKDFLKEVKSVRGINVVFYIEDDYAQQLESKFVNDGPFKSLSGLFKAVLKGEKDLRVKMADIVK